ncbi:NAD(P)-binding oxidoreductase [Enterococcus sp. DIV0086]|uniref:NAD(P)-binding oxidoreductase n=1 Tax=Enterococcus sp. DIV0086 TaxID=2774655 RepID=UPI003D2CAD16
MKVLVVGAHGKVAKYFADFVEEDQTIEERAVIRDIRQQPFFERRGIETVILDIVHDSIDDFSKAMKDVDAVVFSAGAGGRGLDQTVMIDLDGAVKIMTAAEQARVKRFIMISTFRTGREEIRKEIAEDNDLKIYTICKNYADEWLKNRTSLDWTIIHPGILSDSPGTGKIKSGIGNEINKVSRQDVAQTIISTLKNDNTVRKEFEVLYGDTPIDEALKLI